MHARISHNEKQVVFLRSAECEVHWPRRYETAVLALCSHSQRHIFLSCLFPTAAFNIENTPWAFWYSRFAKKKEGRVNERKGGKELRTVEQQQKYDDFHLKKKTRKLQESHFTLRKAKLESCIVFASKTHDYLLSRPHSRRKDFSPSRFFFFSVLQENSELGL